MATLLRLRELPIDGGLEILNLSRKGGISRDSPGIQPRDVLGYCRTMRTKRVCPECGTEEVKTLFPVTDTLPAYLCQNGHFFIDAAVPSPEPNSYTVAGS